MTIDPRSLAIFAILLGLILAATAIVASAENAPTYRSHRPEYGWNVHRFIEVHQRRRNKVFRRETYREREEAAHGRCKPFLAVVGDQYASISGAQDEAKKAFSQTARWLHGERVMSFDNARDVTFECSRSSVGSVVGQVFYRCEVKARPCRAELKGGD